MFNQHTNQTSIPDKLEGIWEITKISNKFEELESLKKLLKEKEQEIIDELISLDIKRDWKLSENILKELDSDNWNLQEKIDNYLNRGDFERNTESELKEILWFLEELSIQPIFWKEWLEVIWYSQSTVSEQRWLDE